MYARQSPLSHSVEGDVGMKKAKNMSQKTITVIFRLSF